MPESVPTHAPATPEVLLHEIAGTYAFVRTRTVWHALWPDQTGLFKGQTLCGQLRDPFTKLTTYDSSFWDTETFCEQCAIMHCRSRGYVTSYAPWSVYKRLFPNLR